MPTRRGGQSRGALCISGHRGGEGLRRVSIGVGAGGMRDAATGERQRARAPHLMQE
ncbi:hypothetical protein B0H10DRAFT_2056989 [Mycena sp. CBHHK59/15]|nr:hypothetical protein B0H10DRAFT_2056989 [Mycena sp. CBHHK59/15]